MAEAWLDVDQSSQSKAFACSFSAKALTFFKGGCGSAVSPVDNDVRG
jgi:hypothetical protein